MIPACIAHFIVFLPTMLNVASSVCMFCISSIVSSSDAGWDWEIKKGIYKVRIKNDGTFEVNFNNDIYTKKFLGLGFFPSRHF